MAATPKTEIYTVFDRIRAQFARKNKFTIIEKKDFPPGMVKREDSKGRLAYFAVVVTKAEMAQLDAAFNRASEGVY